MERAKTPGATLGFGGAPGAVRTTAFFTTVQFAPPAPDLAATQETFRAGARLKPSMNNRPIPLSREVIDQDLQIMRATLSVLLQDIRHISSQAADSVQNAVVLLDQARREFAPQRIKS